MSAVTLLGSMTAEARSLGNLGRKTCDVCHNLKLDEEVPEPESQLVHNIEFWRGRGNLLGHGQRMQYFSLIGYYDLEASASLGDCRFCTLIWTCLEMMNAVPNAEDNPEVRVFARRDYPFYLWWYQGDYERKKFVEVYKENGSSIAVPELGAGLDITGHIFSEHVFLQIEKWLRICTSNHSNCVHNPSFIPRRLIDVGEISAISETTRAVRLVEDLDKPVPYIALSHCWGNDQTCTSTTANHPQRLRGIEWEDLPQTYRDTIIVARRLKIRYIWIDSLCIIQDDLNDWEIESTKMASVYEESYLTLAVSLAPGDGSGFLHENSQRSYYYSQPLRGMDHVKIRNPHYVQDQNRFPQPLLTRAWTLQERVIPQRLLTFSYTVTFECRETNWTESGSGLMENPHVPGVSPWNSSDRDTYRALIETEYNRDEIYRYWIKQVVMPYSHRKLTRASDKLPAVSALAEKFQMKLDDQYVAGMWIGDLHTSLGWRSMTNEALIPNRDHSASTPSWSWASVGGPVFMGESMNEQAEPRRRNLRMGISGCEVMPKGVNNFGELRGGRLSVWGPCLRCHLTVNFGQEEKRQGSGLRVASEPGTTDDGAFPSPLHPTHKFRPLNPAYGELIASTWPPGFLKLAYKLNSVCFDSPLGQVIVEYEEGQTCPGLIRSNAEMQEPVDGMVTCMLLFEKRIGTSLTREFLILGQEPFQRGLFQRLGILSIKLNLTDSPGHVQWFDELPEQSLIIR